MDNNILNEVIEAEKEVQRCLEREQERVRQWLEEVRQEAEKAVAREEQDGSAARGQARELARQAAERRARELRDEAAAAAARLEQIDDRVLTGLIADKLPRILME